MNHSSSNKSLHKGLFHTLFAIISLMLTIGFFIWAFQIWVEVPAERGVKTCYFPYKLYSVLMVKAPQIVLPGDHQLPLRNALRGERYFHACVRFTSAKFPGYAWPDHLPEYAGTDTEAP